jgi:hypothetical protein
MFAAPTMGGRRCARTHGPHLSVWDSIVNQRI